MKQVQQAWLIAIKDLKIFMADRGATFFFIIFPIMFIVLFNFVMKGIGGSDQRLELHLLTLEPAGGLSYQILGAMETKDVSLLKAGDPQIVWDKDYNEDLQAVKNKKLAGFVAFPYDFTRAIMSGNSTSLQVIADASNVNVRAALNGLAGSLSSQIDTQLVTIKASVALLIESGTISSTDSASINQAVQRMIAQYFSGGAAGAPSSFIAFRTQEVGAVVAENPANFVIPGYLVMFVFFAAAIMAESIVRERKNHTLERLLASSVKRESILGGIFTGAVVRGLIQIVIFWGIGILVFRVDLGFSPGAVILLSILMVIMSSAFSLMLATLARTQRSASSLAVITSLVLAPLGGCWWPLFLYPQWLQNIARVTPHAWATTGFNKIMVFGAGFSAAVPNMLALLVFAVIFGTIAAWRFRASTS
jgi:ABC-2 type transport system permease protein